MNYIEEDDIINAKGIYYSYNGDYALKNISFSIGKEFMVIIGPNGSGKTTLIKLIMGLLKPNKGYIKIFGKEPEKVGDRIGYMPQKDYIARHFPIRVRDVLLLGISNKKFIGKEEIEKAKNALEEVGLLPLWNNRFSHLSGGQQQRVIFARAIAKNPDIIIMDEPFNGVDLPSREKILGILRKKKGKITIITVLHNINPVAHDVDKVLLLNKEMIGFGPPKEVLNELNLKRAYGGSVSIVICREGFCHPLIGDTHG